MLLQATSGESGVKSSEETRNEPEGFTHVLDYAPAPGWTVHITKEGRLYYCNHVTRTAGWLPPAEAWRSGENALPYGWERALDDSGRTYYINHVNKTTTYETPVIRYTEPLPIPEPRTVQLERSTTLGFGFVAGSEKPVIVRFVTEGGPSVDKLLPGDQILAVNEEDVKNAPREHVISLVRACSKTVKLTVCQPPEQQGARKSTLLSATKKARLRNKPSRVRFAESVCVNGAPLFPASAFSLGDLCVAPMANVLKVFLENGQTKSFKYDAWTTVHDVMSSLETKLQLQATEHFSLVVEHIKSVKRNKLTLLDPQDTLARIASRPGAYKLRCLYRVAFVPPSAAALAQRDLNALDYLYTQCCNDVIQERFAPELQYDTALRLAALHIYQHALANNIGSGKLTMKTIERDFGLERFVPTSLLENMKRKELRKLIAHFLKLHSSMAGPGKQLTALQAKLHYLDIVSQLPSYGAKCFSAGPKGDSMERVILVSPKFGISQITGTRNSIPVPIANIEEMRRIEVRSDDEVSRTVLIRLQNDKMVSISLEERDASELVLVLRGYFRLTTGQNLPVDQEESAPMDDLAPPYLSQHKVVPEKWSYINHNSVKTACFAMQPVYQGINRKTNGLYNTIGRQSKTPVMLGAYSLDNNMNNSLSNRNHQFKAHFGSRFDPNYELQSVVNMEILDGGKVDAKNEEVLRRVQEMQMMVEDSQKYLTEQENLDRLNALAEWQETSVDIESDNDSQLTDDAPGKLKHSDSLLLLTRDHAQNQTKNGFANAAIEMLRSEMSNNLSESDNDSVIASPHNSPRRINEIKQGSSMLTNNRVSFGLRSPDTGKDATDFQDYLKRMREMSRNRENAAVESAEEMYVFDPDIIDLTMLPPPATPDELDCGALPTPINVPPSSFADSVEKLDKLCALAEEQDLEKFLERVTVPPPTLRVTPSVELTPEEINSFIIPPPPMLVDRDAGQQNEDSSTSDKSQEQESPCYQNRREAEMHENREVDCAKQTVIEYATVDRRGPFSCCSKGKSDKPKEARDECIQPPPRRCSDEKPPERPPKVSPQERTRSHSLTNNTLKTFSEFPPKLPPRSDNNHQAPPHLFLPPKKPPLPPVPSMDVLRSKKNVPAQTKQPSEVRTAGIGSPHLQRSRNMYSELENNLSDKGNSVGSFRQATAVSTPTSPHLGRGFQFSAASKSRDSPPTTPPLQHCSHLRSNSYNHYDIKSRIACFESKRKESEGFSNGGTSQPSPVRNGCSSTGENLIAKTDVAMASLLVRLDQVAAQCSAAQTQGGGRLICEEKFQAAKEELISQSLQLVSSSKMLVIAMSDLSLPDLPENLAICLTILRRLTELCQDLANHTTAPLQTRNLILKVHDVTAAFRKLITSDIDRSSQKVIEEQLAAQAEGLANVLATLLRILRVFSP
ncbi:uncharacterized protein LOC123314773 isoform X2 [Coccinella septempunctata]|uniref:uncharacterized protein LOC123314773 isoform X2 n=1 Tax=Coccinella septempunctata TaxID=41139 RepID=UPI001D0620C4|nr:uncharacterized protein LOC123314773 isoform X2 [Coccinella septempunctata]